MNSLDKYNKSIGNFGERAAEKYLRKNGYKIADRNYLIRGGEIDIIAKKGTYTVFVEVKTRRNDSFGTPSEAVTYNKKMRMIKAASVYLMYKEETDVRFDVMEVYVKKGFFGLKADKINHIENAFER